MTTEKHDPWALLREARESVALEVAAVAAFRVSDADKRVLDLLGRINAALAAHEAEERVDSATPIVEWQTDAFGNDYVKQDNMLSMVVQTLDGNWGWETRVEGYADTEAEAQRAALSAARGMK